MSDNENHIEGLEESGTAGELEALRAEAADLRDRLLRALADADNTRKRAEREKQDASQYAVTRFARDMLQIADNFARALAACPPELRAAADPQVKAVIDGVEATERQLLATLERHGVKPIDTADGRFDPNFHQAIAEVPGSGRPAGSIVDVVQPGYVIGERLLRPAMVTVARREPAAQEAGSVDTKA
ncbi:MAG TPA: nucleotide exchange factor GrpE [Rhizomicrobium sp.]|jgi:molecular chaperone GrpE|nr:nucleotide exchange factor GrpE [Rhizomicrobium sp.]